MAMRFLIPGILFLLTLVFGFWLSHGGRPYNGALFNVHKLVALGAVIVTAVQLARVLKGADSPGLIILLLVVAAICVVALFATGTLMSLGRMDYALMLWIHRIAPVVLVVAIGVAAYRMTRPG
jgi:hypothetical protein